MIVVMAVIQYAVLNDIHFPYESRAYYEALKLIEAFPALRGLYLNGDIAEIESVSTHPKTPGAQRSLLKELEYVNSKFDDLQKRFKNLPIEFLEGNHCHRVFRYIRDVAPEMWGLIKLPSLFHFPDRPNWSYNVYHPNQILKCGKANLYLRHEPLSGGATHAKGTAEKSVVNLLYGHTHVYQSFTHKKFGPTPYLVTATSGGWLGDIKQCCFDYRGSKDNWVTGFTRIDCDEKTGEYELRFINL